MKKEDNIDQLIRDALSKEETDFYDNLDEQSLPEMMTGLFKGKLKWFAVLTTVLSLVWFIVAVYCAVQFFDTEVTRDMIVYGAGFFMSMMIVSMLKIWNWMQMDKNAILRELKRLELQISMLKKGSSTHS